MLFGINNVMARKKKRKEAWQRLAGDPDRKKLNELTRTIGSAEVTKVIREILEDQVGGRVVVAIG